MFSQLPELNLPVYEAKIRIKQNMYEIFDIYRKKWLKLTPEEWIRQSFLNHLTMNLNYPFRRIGVEFEIKYGKLKKRTDAVVFDEKGRPQVIIECKAPTVELQEDVFFQACMYNRMLKAGYLFLTNGIKHITAKISNENINFLENIPDYYDLD